MLLLRALYSDTKKALNHILVHAWINNKFSRFSPAIIISFSALYLASSVIRSPSFASEYNLFVIMSMLFLAFKVRLLSHQCHEAHRLLDQLKRVPYPSGGDCHYCSLKKLPSSCRSCHCHGLVAKETHGRFGTSNGVEDQDHEQEEKEEGIDVVMKLKKELLKEKEARIALMEELEEESKAAATAADEAMAKIQWLHREKALIETEAKQYRAISEQKQMYDQEVIESLKWIVSMFEAERRSCRDGGGVCVHSQCEQVQFGEEQLIDNEKV